MLLSISLHVLGNVGYYAVGSLVLSGMFFLATLYYSALEGAEYSNMSTKGVQEKLTKVTVQKVKMMLILSMIFLILVILLAISTLKQ